MKRGAVPPRAGGEVELEIESLATGGEGVGRREGRVFFVPATAPGDRIRAGVVEVRPRFARARMIRLLQRGPSRREPPCPNAGLCGGCSWQHLGEAAQRHARERILRDALQRIGRLRDLPPVEHVISPRNLGYRSRTRLAHDHGLVGYRAAGSRRIVRIDACPVLDPETGRALEALGRNPPPGRGEVEVRGYGKQLEVAGHRLQVGRRAFFQANRSLWDEWHARVVEVCGRGALALELYAGVGFYTFGLEGFFDQVIAVERGPAARDLARNTGAVVVRGSVESWIPSRAGRLAPDLVLLNPPRAGCHARVTEGIRRMAPSRVVHVSCNPPTLARDLARLGPGFRLDRLLLIEALPQTHHVEAVAVLRRIGPRGAPAAESPAPRIPAEGAGGKLPRKARDG